jgi:hypothetical protein
MGDVDQIMNSHNRRDSYPKRECKVGRMKNIKSRELNTPGQPQHFIQGIWPRGVLKPSHLTRERRWDLLLVPNDNGNFDPTGLEQSSDEVLCVYAYPAVSYFSSINEKTNRSGNRTISGI